MTKANKTTTWRSLLTGSFVVTAVVLVVAALTLRPALAALAKRYAKTPASIRRPLQDFDISRLPSFGNDWESTAVPIPPDQIGTDQCVYLILRHRDKTAIPNRIEFFVTYYNDPREKVPHTPDVCSRQGGAIVLGQTTTVLKTPELAPEHPEIQARLLTYSQRGSEVIDIYVFYVEGQFKYTRGQVRWVIGMPGNRRTFFSKIEAVVPVPNPANRPESVAMLKKFLCQAIPILLTEYFPDTESLEQP